jgi:FKBP-type peptidyl-prolyl cis-trans isomerase FklB
MKIHAPAQGALITASGGAAAVLALMAALLSSGCGNSREPAIEAPSDVALDSDERRASYAVGYTVAGNVDGEFGTFLDHDAFLAGLEDSLAGRSTRLTDEQITAAMTAMRAAGEDRKVAEANANLEAGRAFLEENAAREGVVSLASGLQYEVIVEGDGPKPTAADTVTTHYHGTLPDGTVFDSSVDRGQPASFPVGGVIRGWVEALQLMPVGSKWRLYIPPELGYGTRGAGAKIGPNQVLIFEVELLEIQGTT